MKKLSIVTVAFNNIEGIKQTYKSLLSLDESLNDFIEWIVVDGNSMDGTKEFLKVINIECPIHMLYISEKDAGIYDGMNKGILKSCGEYILFLNSGDILTTQASKAINELFKYPYDAKNMFIFDAFLNYDGKSKSIRRAKSGFYIYHSLPASHQAIVYPTEKLKEIKYDLSYRVSGDYAITAKLYKNGINFKKIDHILSEFSMGGVSTTNNIQLCDDARRVQLEILKMPKILVGISYRIRVGTTEKTKVLYGKKS